jgi:hypothetical protein
MRAIHVGLITECLLAGMALIPAQAQAESMHRSASAQAIESSRQALSGRFPRTREMRFQEASGASREIHASRSRLEEQFAWTGRRAESVSQARTAFQASRSRIAGRFPNARLRR